MAQLAPLATATIATSALGIAIWSLVAQRTIARKRAAIDFFLKTEMDKEVLQAHRNFTAAVKQWKCGANEFPFEFAKTDSYKHINAYLTIHELIAVGISQKAFNDGVCYSFWCHELIDAHVACEGLIKHIREEEGRTSAFWYFSKLNKRWTKRMKRAKWFGRSF